MSKIEWTEETWNPIAGCSIISEGCQNCYAMSLANRLGSIGATKDKYGDLTRKTESGRIIWNGNVRFDEKALLEPLKRKKPTMYFVNSMSDLFHEAVPTEWIDKVFAIMALCPEHTFQVLTKRPDRMKAYLTVDKDSLIYPRFLFQTHNIEHSKTIDIVYKKQLACVPLKNVWLGASAENQETFDSRIDHLIQTPASVRFVSAEPLLSDIQMITEEVDYLRGEWYGNDEGLVGKIDWVIVGGESGHNARPMKPDWVRHIRDQCQETKTPFFFKQWGGKNKKKSGNLLDGQKWEQMPFICPSRK